MKDRAIGKGAGAQGVRIVGMTCVGQDMQLRGRAPGGTDIFAGQAGNNFTQEALLATGAIDMVISEFNCTLSGIEPIAEKQQIKLICLDDVAKLTSSELLADIHGQEGVLAEKTYPHGLGSVPASSCPGSPQDTGRCTPPRSSGTLSPASAKNPWSSSSAAPCSRW